eukprot:tig00020556_g10991.t1
MAKEENGGSDVDSSARPWRARLFASAAIAGPEHNGPAHGVLVAFKSGPPARREDLVKRAAEEGLIREEHGDVVVARWRPRLERFDVVTKSTPFEYEEEEACFVLEPRGEGLCAGTYNLTKPAAANAGANNSSGSSDGSSSTPARAPATLSGAKRAREEEEQQQAGREGPVEKSAAGGSALEQLPDGIVLRVLELAGVVGACRMRAVSRRLRAVAAGRADPPQQALLDLMEFEAPHRVLRRLLEAVEGKGTGRGNLGTELSSSPEVDHLLSAPSLCIRMHDARTWGPFIALLHSRAARDHRAPLVSVHVSFRLETGHQNLSFVHVVSALKRAGGSLEELRFDVEGEARFDQECETGHFAAFPKLRVLAMHGLYFNEDMAKDIAKSLPSLRTLEVYPSTFGKSVLKALAPLALEELVIAGDGEVARTAHAQLEELCKAPGASASLRVLSFRLWRSHRDDGRDPYPCTRVHVQADPDPFQVPPAFELPISTIEAIAGLPNLEYIEGYVEFRRYGRNSYTYDGSDEDYREKHTGELEDDPLVKAVGKLGNMPKLYWMQVRTAASPPVPRNPPPPPPPPPPTHTHTHTHTAHPLNRLVLVRLDSSVAEHNAIPALVGLVYAHSDDPGFTVDLFIAGDPAGTKNVRLAANAVSDIVDNCPELLCDLTVVGPPAPAAGASSRVLAFPLSGAGRGEDARSLRLALAVESLRELWPLRELREMEPSSPLFRLTVHLAVPRRALVELARADLAAYLPPCASLSVAWRQPDSPPGSPR